jgi:hypothetical protein
MFPVQPKAMRRKSQPVLVSRPNKKGPAGPLFEHLLPLFRNGHSVH